MNYLRDDLLWLRIRGPFYGMVAKHQGWVRLFGYGVAWKDSTVIRPLFSERNGFIQWFSIGPWRVLGR